MPLFCPLVCRSDLCICTSGAVDLADGMSQESVFLCSSAIVSSVCRLQTPVLQPDTLVTAVFCRSLRGRTQQGFSFPRTTGLADMVLLSFVSLIFQLGFSLYGTAQYECCAMGRPTLCMGLYDLVNRRFPIAPQKIFKYSFFLYALHYLPVHVGQRIVLSLGDSPWLPYVAYFGVPALTVLLAIVVSVCMDRYAHSLYSLLSGGR